MVSGYAAGEFAEQYEVYVCYFFAFLSGKEEIGLEEANARENIDTSTPIIGMDSGISCGITDRNFGICRLHWGGWGLLYTGHWHCFQA